MRLAPQIGHDRRRRPGPTTLASSPPARRFASSAEQGGRSAPVPNWVPGLASPGLAEGEVFAVVLQPPVVAVVRPSIDDLRAQLISFSHGRNLVEDSAEPIHHPSLLMDQLGHLPRLFAPGAQLLEMRILDSGGSFPHGGSGTRRRVTSPRCQHRSKTGTPNAPVGHASLS